MLGEALVRLQICFENDIARVLGEQAQVEFVDIGITPSTTGPSTCSVELAEALRAIPVRLHPDGDVSVASSTRPTSRCCRS